MKPTRRMKLFKDDIDFSRAIIEMTQEVIVLLDTEGRIMDCNVFMENLSGYTAPEIIGRNWHDTLIFMGGTAISQKYFRKTIARKRIPRTEVYRLVAQSGDPLYLEFNFRVIKDSRGEFTGVLVVGYDVTGRVQHEQSLEEERFDLIERNKELTCLYQIANLANDEQIILAEMLQSISELIPDALQFSDFADACIRLDNTSYLSAGFSPADQRLLEPITIQGINRGHLEIVYHPAPEDSSKGGIDFMPEERHLAQAVARHLSLIIEKREADERKLELEQQLRHAERLATIGQLAAGVAHELNEPLGNILGFAQLAGRDKGLPDQLYKDLDKIVKSALHAREIIKKLMLFGRRMPPQEMAISLNKIVEDGLYFLEARCVKSGIVVHKQIDPDLPMVDADPSQLEQVLVNLVINAIQAMDQGGELTIRTFAGEGQVHLAVGDTGPGIEDEVMAQIFVPFFTTKDVDEGTGLGLSVVHGIVTTHNGRIDVDTKVGRGTTFTISIPLFME
jgi:two-component system, NtrC family, sensor kinase